MEKTFSGMFLGTSLVVFSLKVLFCDYGFQSNIIIEWTIIKKLYLTLTPSLSLT